MEEYVIELPVCRACLNSSVECIEMDALILNELDEEDSQTYLDCFKFCTQLDIQIDDREPRHLCPSCSSELRAAYEFITKAKISHDLLLGQPYDEVKLDGYVYENKQNSRTEEGTDEQVFYHMTVKDNENVEEEVIDSESETKYNIEKAYDSDIKVSEQETEADDEVSIDDFNEVEIIEDEQQFETIFKCNLCTLHFVKLSDLKEHGEQDHESAKFCCQTCFHRFSNKFTLTDHIKRQHDNSLVKCNICGVLVLNSLLRSHKRQEHKRTTYLCTACPRIFKTLTGLQIHTETHKENRQRNFQCEKCNKKFLTERTFKVHERTHWEREHFKCKLCDKQFLQKINLKLHMQMHRGETMDCMYCEKKFVRKMDLTVHMRFHTGNFPYECQHCDKRFAIVSHLNYHQKRHQGFMYKCEVCEKEFINKSGLRNHSFQHTMMPFNCSLCDKGFPTKFKIKRHLKTVHHVEDNDDFNQYIKREKVKNEPANQETIEEELLEQIVGE